MYYTLTEKSDQCINTESELVEVYNSYFKTGKYTENKNRNKPSSLLKLSILEVIMKLSN